ncbi:MAG: alpha-glucosidase/alpha-galactosidase [Oscillospiraceae bacterium]
MKITFLGAGSSIFVRNVLGDCMTAKALGDATYALYDIDETRLLESRDMLQTINRNSNQNRATIETYAGTENIAGALKGANFVINAIQVGGYKPSTVIDFEIPKKYGLRQTIADTLGIGGIFRALRTIPVMEFFAGEMARHCPDAIFLNYTNPMGILTGYMLRHTPIQTVGLCHSVQKCAAELLKGVGLAPDDTVNTYIAGINHMAWLLKITRNGEDLYPEIKRLAKQNGAPEDDMVRFEIMDKFGYYVTESSEHNSEYMPYFIKQSHPDLVEKFNVPLDEYLRRCVRNINRWEDAKKEIIGNENLTHTRSLEYAASMIEAFALNAPYKFNGNVLNTGVITNLPEEACVEVPCIIDANGVQPIYVGKLPQQCAALNRTNINVQLLTIDAAKTRKKEAVYHAALLDPHTAAELSIDEIISMCNDMFEAHGDMIPQYS